MSKAWDLPIDIRSNPREPAATYNKAALLTIENTPPAFPQTTKRGTAATTYVPVTLEKTQADASLAQIQAQLDAVSQKLQQCQSNQKEILEGLILDTNAVHQDVNTKLQVLNERTEQAKKANESERKCLQELNSKIADAEDLRNQLKTSQDELKRCTDQRDKAQIDMKELTARYELPEQFCTLELYNDLEQADKDIGLNSAIYKDYDNEYVPGDFTEIEAFPDEITKYRNKINSEAGIFPAAEFVVAYFVLIVLRVFVVLLKHINVNINEDDITDVIQNKYSVKDPKNELIVRHLISLTLSVLFDIRLEQMELTQYHPLKRRWMAKMFTNNGLLDTVYNITRTTVRWYHTFCLLFKFGRKKLWETVKSAKYDYIRPSLYSYIISSLTLYCSAINTDIPTKLRELEQLRFYNVVAIPFGSREKENFRNLVTSKMSVQVLPALTRYDSTMPRIFYNLYNIVVTWGNRSLIQSMLTIHRYYLDRIKFTNEAIEDKLEKQMIDEETTFIEQRKKLRAETQLQTIKALREQQKAHLEKLKSQLKNAELMAGKGDLSKEEAEAANNTLLSLRSQISVIEKELEQQEPKV